LSATGDTSAIEIRVPAAYAGRKSGRRLEAGGMGSERLAEWTVAFRLAVEPHASRLRPWFESKRHLAARVTVFGPRERVEPLDIHDALAQVLDQLTDLLYPRPAGRPIPQWRDRYFWDVSGHKSLANEAEVHITIEALDEPSDALERAFHTDCRAWKDASRFLSNPVQMAMLPPYQRIIGLGPRAVPLLLRELEREPDHWFWALEHLTRENPVPAAAVGDLLASSQAWVEWGRRRGSLP
jgi:hypothetical protein